MGALREKETLYSVADLFWSCIVLSPLVVVFWRGTWDILDDISGLDDGNSQNDQRHLSWNSGIGTHITGLLVRIFVDLLIYHFAERVHGWQSPRVRSLATWALSLLSAWAAVSFWRGVWFLMRLDLGVSSTTVTIVLASSVVILIGCDIARSLAASPNVVSLDQPELALRPGTFFRKTPSDRWWFLVDVLFSNVVVHHLIVFAWWSLWSLENNIFGMDRIGVKEKLVSWPSVLLGYGLTLLSFSLDQCLPMTTKLYVVKPLSVIVSMVTFVASVNVWRGVWSLIDHYFFPSLAPWLNHLISHLVGVVGLTLAGAFNTVNNRNIIKPEDGVSVVTIKYWKRKNVPKPEDEAMIPIVE